MEGSKRKADDQDQNQNPNPFQQPTTGYNGGRAAKVPKLNTPQPQAQSQQAPAGRGRGATTRGGANNRWPTNNNRGAPSNRRATTNQRGAGRGAGRGTQRWTPLGGQRGGQRGRTPGQRAGIRGPGRGLPGAGRGIPGVGRGVPGIGRGVPGPGAGRGQGRGRGAPNPPPLPPQPPQPPPQQSPQQFLPNQLPAQQNPNAQKNPQLQPPPAGPPVQRPPIPPQQQQQQQATNFNTQWDQAAEARWLASSSTWEMLGQPGWRGVKFLGRGGFGIVGLWQRNNIYYRRTESVVVKQHNMCLDLLENEAYYIQLLSEGGGTHTVRLIKGYWEGQGGGSGIMDPDTRVGRIYLEFCENGDMDGFIKKMNSHYSADDPIPEELVWKIWLCLARAAVTLETGQEDITGDIFAPVSLVPVTHLDIKTENVLLGSLDNGPHRTVPIFKVADFGLALQHRVDDQNEENWNRTKLCGTDGWRAPEFTRIFDRYSKNIHKYGPWTNVWSLSKCIYHLLTRYQDVDEFHKTCVHEYDMYRIESAYTTYGANLKKYIPDGVYSEQLRNSLWHSIARVPGQRPRTKELLRNIILTLKWWDDENQGNEDDEFWDYYDEPETNSNSDPNPMTYSRGMGDMTPGYRRDIDPVASLQVPEDMPDVDMGGV